MSYATKAKISGHDQAFLAVLKPTYLVEAADWTISSGQYYLAFSLGRPSRVWYVSTATGFYYNDLATEVSAKSSLSGSSRWYYDEVEQQLWVNSNVDYLVEFEVYVSDLPIVWHRIPSDTTTSMREFRPILLDFPNQKSSADDLLQGYAPRFSGSLTLGNENNEIGALVADNVSFHESRVEIYRWVNFQRRDPNDLQRFVTGVVSSPVFKDATASFSVSDFKKLLEKSPQLLTMSRIKTTVLASTGGSGDVNPSEIGSLDNPARVVYGEIADLPCYNFDYSASVSTANNRVWFLHCAVGIPGELPYQNVSNSTIVQNVKINGTTISGTDYTITKADSSALVGSGVSYIIIELSATAESNAGIGTFNPETDTLTASVRGAEALVNINGSLFRKLPAVGSYISKNPASHLLHYLIGFYGVTEDDIDQDSWDAAGDATSHETQLVIPGEFGGSSAETGISTVNAVLVSGIFVLYLTDTGKLGLSYVGAMGDPDFKIDEAEFTEAFEYEINHDDTAQRVKHVYNTFEIEASATSSITLQAYLSKSISSEPKVVSSLATADSPLRARYEALLLYPETRATVGLGPEYFHINVGDVVQLNQKNQPGMAYTGTKQAKNYRVTGVDRSRNGIRLELTDQPGVEANSGDF